MFAVLLAFQQQIYVCNEWT